MKEGESGREEAEKDVREGERRREKGEERVERRDERSTKKNSSNILPFVAEMLVNEHQKVLFLLLCASFLLHEAKNINSFFQTIKLRLTAALASLVAFNRW